MLAVWAHPVRTKTTPSITRRILLRWLMKDTFLLDSIGFIPLNYPAMIQRLPERLAWLRRQRIGKGAVERRLCFEVEEGALPSVSLWVSLSRCRRRCLIKSSRLRYQFCKGMTRPGLRIFLGSIVPFKRCITSISGGLRVMLNQGNFSVPMPCSAEMEPSNCLSGS